MYRFVRVVPTLAALLLLPVGLFAGPARAATHVRAASQAATHAAATGYAEFQDAQLVPVGKLGTSKRPELLDQRLIGASPRSTSVGFTLREAGTGKAVWRRTLPLVSDDYLTVLPEPVGKPARRGLVVIDTPDGFSFAAQTLSMWALNGSTGKIEWSRTFVQTGAATASDIPAYDGVLRAPVGQAQNFLIALGATDAGTSYAEQADVIRGADGTVVDLGSPVDTGADPASFTPLPDVNGDGYGDVLLAEDGSPGTLRAESGVTAAPIWTRSDLDVSSLPYTQTSADVSDLGKFGSAHELVVETGEPSENLLGAYKLNAATGGGTWSHLVTGINLLGRAGPHLAPAFGYYTITGAGTGSRFTTTVTWTAVGTSGATIYRRHFTVSAAVPANLEGTDANGGMDLAGDVQPDGAKEFGVQGEAYAYSSTVEHDVVHGGVVDGRTGALHKFAPFSTADGSLRRGAATDLLTTGISHGHPTVAGWRGATRKRYYRRTISGLSGWTAAWVSGARATGHPCSDLTLSAANATHGVLAVLSARGTPLWSVRFSAAQAVGGSFHRYAAPRHYCVS